jgi:hypothetical protein
MDNFCPVHSITLTEPGSCPECPAPAPPGGDDPTNALNNPNEAGDPPDVSNERKKADGPDVTSGNNKEDLPLAEPVDDEKEPQEVIGRDTGQDDPENNTDSDEVQFEHALKEVFSVSKPTGVNNKKGRVTDSNLVSGNFNNVLIQEFAKEKAASLLPIFDLGNPTPPDAYGLLADEYTELVSLLRHERVLMLGNSGDGEAQIVSRQIARCLEIDQAENIRFYSLSHRPPDDARPYFNIHSFSFERNLRKGGKNRVVIVDATSQFGKDFAESLLEESVIFDYPSVLTRNQLFLICLLESQNIEMRIGKSGRKLFPYRAIRKKDEQGPGAGIVIDIVAAGALLKNIDCIEAPIIRTILFVASFFPGLTTGDFNDLVSRFLRAHSDLIQTETGENGETSVKSVSLSNLWDLNAHLFTERCFLTQTRTERGKRIDFENPAYAVYFSEQIESRFFVFFDKKLSEILDFGLIFHPSDEIAGHSINLVSEYIPETKARFTEWLLEIFKYLEKMENSIDALKARFHIEELPSKNFCYRRLADLFRMMSGEVLEKIGREIMDLLMRATYFRSALELIKQLQFARNLDSSYWLKQLLERGDSNTQEEALTYLFKSFIDMNFGSVLDRLQIWLSDKTTAAGNYSNSNKAALGLIIDYYSYRTYVFEEQFYGREPCQFPLFRFDSESSVESQIDLITKYLMHPAFLSSERSVHTITVAIFLADWAEILFSSHGSRGPGSDYPTTPDFVEPDQKNPVISNDEILTRLLEGVCQNSNKEQQQKMAYVWTKYMDDLAPHVHDFSLDRNVRERAAEKRRIIRNLGERFRKCRRALK